MNYIEDLIYPSLEDIKENLDNPEALILSPETRLFGSESALSSIDMVNLLVDIESLIEDKLNISITIANEKAMSRKNSPFKTVQSLADYIKELVEEAQNG